MTQRTAETYVAELLAPENREAVEAIIAATERFEAESGMAENPVYQGLKEGRTLAQIRGMSREDLEVLYGYGYTLLTQKFLDKALVIFSHLALIDPLEARNHYCLGACLQQQGNMRAARDAFATFIALDATNPEGLMRLGECLLAEGDREAAGDAFRLALGEAEKGHGTAKSRDAAEARIAMLDLTTGDQNAD
ncbi:tetratricopeptide repeat protein [Celeribacter naphthalenivorans]|uniref:tetratricopeptide repeat protein n=1 Tax=Celeribacter naphthalenivorans TaxID=1614694 RepID=UPI001CF95B56|nr:tetratricopeptide repeat protein [Celeribacter naphthalenivorans]